MNTEYTILAKFVKKWDSTVKSANHRTCTCQRHYIKLCYYIHLLIIATEQAEYHRTKDREKLEKSKENTQLKLTLDVKGSENISVKTSDGILHVYKC